MAGDAARPRVAILAPMGMELRPLLRALSLRRERSASGVFRVGALGRVDVVATIAGVGTRAAARATERVLTAHRVDRVIVVGIAGGIGAGVAIGDLVVPERVLDLATGRAYRPAPLGEVAPRATLLTSDRLIVERDEIARLEGEGAVAVDMETAAVAAVCDERGCPWSVFRAVSDRAGDCAIDEAVARLAHPGGGPDLGALARLVLAQPWRVPGLLRLARGARLAASAAASAAARALETL
jgi:adenosylhomocysteine nucleosidase